MTVPAYRLVAVPDVIGPDGAVLPRALRQHLLKESLLRRRCLLRDTAKAFSEAVASRDGRLTETEHAYWDMLMAEMEELDIRISAL